MALLVGREVEVSRLSEALLVAQDRCVLVVIEGVAGLGKTALLEHARAEARRWGVAIYAGSADPVETDRPFGALIDALSLWPMAGEGPVPMGNPSLFALAADARYQVIDLICARVETFCAPRPTALLVDDLHWADASVPMALRKLRQRLGAHPAPHRCCDTTG